MSCVLDWKHVKDPTQYEVFVKSVGDQGLLYTDSWKIIVGNW